MNVAIICAGLLGVLVFGLGMAVSQWRVSSASAFGASPDPSDGLYRIVRAHGNATEYAPMLAVLILFLGTQDPATWVLWVMCIATAARYLHAAGMMLGPGLDQIQPLRFVGAGGTYLGGLALCAAVFLG